jgi:hypothetical protein
MSVFPSQSGAANPLVGRPLFLLKESFDKVEWDACSCWQDAASGLELVLSAEVAAMCASNHQPAAIHGRGGENRFFRQKQLLVPAGSYYVFGVTHNNRVALS